MAKLREVISNLKKLKTGKHKLYMSDNSFCYVLGTCSVFVQRKNGDHLVLTNVLYAPKMRKNLISIPQLDKKGF